MWIDAGGIDLLVLGSRRTFAKRACVHAGAGASVRGSRNNVTGIQTLENSSNGYA